MKVRGVVYERATRWGRVVEKWPRRRGKATSGYDLYRQLEFGYVARFIGGASVAEQETARYWTKGTDFVFRDMLMQLAMGKGFIIIDAQGNVWQSWRVTNPNPQLILDLVGNTPGAVLYRSSLGWVIATPGAVGTVLTTVADGVVAFAPGGAGGSEWTDLPISPTSFGAAWSTGELYEAGAGIAVGDGAILEVRAVASRPGGAAFNLNLSPDGVKALQGAIQTDNNWVSYRYGAFNNSATLLHGGGFSSASFAGPNLIEATLQIGAAHTAFSAWVNRNLPYTDLTLKASLIDAADADFVASNVCHVYIGVDAASGVGLPRVSYRVY